MIQVDPLSGFVLDVKNWSSLNGSIVLGFRAISQTEVPMGLRKEIVESLLERAL